MKRLSVLLLAVGMIAMFAVPGAGAAATGTPTSYLLLLNGPPSARLAEQVEAAGGALTGTIPQVGIAVASSTDLRFRSKASRLGTVVPNLHLQWIDPVQPVAGPSVNLANPPNSGAGDVFFDLQWGHAAIDAVAAWESGARGEGARVAVLDTGFDLTHPDLVPNIDLASSVDMTGKGLQYTLDDPFSHGTHVAGTVAAAQNDFGVIGVAPDAELVLVKVLADDGSGSFDDVIAGIVHAADVGSHVINMSLGAALPRRGLPEEDMTARDVTAVVNAIGRATTYAYQQGATVISSAGNDANDSDKNKDLVYLPADAPRVLSISATGPVGWGVDFTTSLDEPASYTNFGRSAIDLAAPGGDFLYPGDEDCTVAGQQAPCWVFDLVFSTGNKGWFWSAGTSMAAPHAAGVAALIVGEHDGAIHPAQVESLLRRSADDLGSPGKDPYYGHGRVNASSAVG